MTRWIYFSVLTFLALTILIVDGRRGLWYTNTQEYQVDKCFGEPNEGKLIRDKCCQDYCSKNTKCIFGQTRQYTYENNTIEDVCLCYTCRPKEWFKVKNRISSNDIVMIDFPYCTILLPNRANELCRGYCNEAEKCVGDGGCGVNIRNETIDRCICHKCPARGENFYPVFDPMF